MLYFSTGFEWRIQFPRCYYLSSFSRDICLLQISRRPFLYNVVNLINDFFSELTYVLLPCWSNFFLAEKIFLDDGKSEEHHYSPESVVKV
jgi:hypothetical protein